MATNAPLTTQSQPQDTSQSVLPFTFNVRRQAASLDPPASQTVVIIIDNVLHLIIIIIIMGIITSLGGRIFRDEWQETPKE